MVDFLETIIESQIQYLFPVYSLIKEGKINDFDGIKKRLELTDGVLKKIMQFFDCIDFLIEENGKLYVRAFHNESYFNEKFNGCTYPNLESFVRVIWNIQTGEHVKLQEVLFKILLLTALGDFNINKNPDDYCELFLVYQVLMMQNTYIFSIDNVKDKQEFYDRIKNGLKEHYNYTAKSYNHIKLGTLKGFYSYLGLVNPIKLKELEEITLNDETRPPKAPESKKTFYILNIDARLFHLFSSIILNSKDMGLYDFLYKELTRYLPFDFIENAEKNALSPLYASLFTGIVERGLFEVSKKADYTNLSFPNIFNENMMNSLKRLNYIKKKQVN